MGETPRSPRVSTWHGRNWVVRRSRRGFHTGLFALLVGLGSVAPQTAFALSGDQAAERAEQALREVEASAANLKTQVRGAQAYKPESLVAAAELHLRTGQHDDAIEKLNRVIELGRQGKASASTTADAQFWLGEAYFGSGELYSARRQFEYITDHAEEQAYAPVAARAASRLVDVALQVQRKESLPDILARIEGLSQSSSLTSGEKGQALKYARAKALLALEQYESARSTAEEIQKESAYRSRARYLQGVALMKQAQDAVPAEPPGVLPDYASAISTFEQLANDLGSSSDAETRTIVELSWLAVARLNFEKGRYLRASSAYEKIPRTSEHFARALFELSWTYVRMGDYQRGQRSLEVLSVLDPGLIDGADAALLRADLLLRSGRFTDAENAYLAVRATYEPLREQLDDYLLAHDDPAVYYDKLTASEIEGGQELPPLVLGWAREEAREDRVFAIVDDVARARNLVKRSRRSVTLLRASLGSETRAKVFPELRRTLEETVALINQLAVARLSLARGMDDEAGRDSGDLQQTRVERRKWMTRLGQVPTSPGDFSVRESEIEKQWNVVSQKVQRLELEADHLHALVNGLKRVLREAERHGVTADAEALERYRAEIAENEKEMASYRERIASLRQQVEMGRVQSGFGDERFVEDDQVRVAFREAFEKEVDLVQKGADTSAQSYAGKIQPLLVRIRSAEAQLEQSKQKLDAEVRSRGEELLQQIETESRSLEAYAAQLDTLDQHARVLVGEVARDNFQRVRGRLKDVVLRADVGTVQKSWEVRENLRLRVRDLLRERAREERFINDELREVLDDVDEAHVEETQ